MMEPRKARLIALVDLLDEELAGRPAVFTSPIGFALGTIISVSRSDPGATLAMLELGERLLGAVSAYLDGDMTLESVRDLVASALTSRASTGAE